MASKVVTRTHQTDRYAGCSKSTYTINSEISMFPLIDATTAPIATPIAALC